MDVSTAVALGGIIALAVTVGYYTVILSSKKGEVISPFFRKIRYLLSIEYLLIEKVITAWYVFTTLGCISVGFFLLFSRIKGFYSSSSTFIIGILLILLGPILNRLIYEGCMLFIILVKNTSQINAKIGARNDSDEKSGATNDSGFSGCIEKELGKEHMSFNSEIKLSSPNQLREREKP